MNIEELRNKIDSIDSELIRLFQERMETAASIADYKKENGLPVFDAEREKAVVDKVTSALREELVPFGEKLYEAIFELSRSYQEKRMNGECC